MWDGIMLFCISRGTERLLNRFELQWLVYNRTMERNTFDDALARLNHSSTLT